MPTLHEGNLIAQNLNIAFVVARFNSFITERLLEGALDTLSRHGGNADNAHVFKVPGCFEVPMAAKKIAESGKFDAVVCLGALIRGETPHFDYIAAEATKGIAQIALSCNIPVTYGVITVNNLEQAIDRAGTKSGNKGAEATLAAIEMVNLYKNL